MVIEDSGWRGNHPAYVAIDAEIDKVKTIADAKAVMKKMAKGMK